MVNLESRLRPSDEVVWRELGDSLIVLNTATGRYFRLDRPGAAIWQSIETYGRAAAMIEALAERYDCAAGEIEPDVRAVLDMAAANGLLAIDGGSDSVSAEATSDPPTLQITRSSLTVRGSLEPLRADFERQHHVRLPQLIEPRLLQLVAHMVETGEFVDRTHDGIGTELCLVPGVATSALQLLFNDPALLETVAAIAACDRIGCFDGRAYRMSAGAGHYDSWHSDVGEDRLVAISVNFSPEPYDGGVLEIRRASSQEILHEVPNGDFGSAVMFAVSPSLRHRVNAVRGSRPRTAYAGWFRSSPDFQDLFFASLPGDAA